MTVIATLELDDAVTARETTRQTPRGHASFGSGTRQTYNLDGRNAIADKFRQLGLCLGRCTERTATAKCRFNRVLHFGVAVPKDQRSPRSDAIDIFLPRDIPNLGSFTRDEKHWGAAN